MTEIIPPTSPDAQQALTMYAGADLDRATAARLLPYWCHYGQLSATQIEAVLDWFPRRDTPETIEMPALVAGFQALVTLYRERGGTVDLTHPASRPGGAVIEPLGPGLSGPGGAL